ncbi:response regulator [Pelagibius sp. 7325]|uniref:response regulator transcription factor n=1 Tax=Pelagibius sp. 7325 TaxID=3131994 RepID=UPI0030EE07A2
MIVKHLIAVVDDDASAREAIAGLVKAFGYMVCLFESAAAFLRSDQSRSSACLIADMQMAEMSGLELFLTLVATGNPIPAILITAYPDEATRRRALQAGVIAFLAKPVDSETLLACLSKAIGAQRN